jgi:hypothetical protein
MPIDFPASPSVGQTYSYGGVTYTYTATGWSVSSPFVGAVVAAGDLMLFQSTAAPVGWTKQTAHNDKALRLVGGAAGSSGSIPFSALFARTQIDNFTLTITETPSHLHDLLNYPSTSPGPYASSSGGDVGSRANSDYNGGGQVHAHGFDMRVQYVDAIIASKN